jgi:hypothetical protein
MFKGLVVGVDKKDIVENSMEWGGGGAWKHQSWNL